MSQVHFDPFSNRLARDIRNNLSRSFIKSLAEKDVSFFQKCAAEYLQQKLDPIYEQYITRRLEKYVEAVAAIEEGELRETLPQAALLWDLELYFEMHELLEPLWQGSKGDRRRALQGLIRAAGMKILAENKKKAAVSIGAKALTALRKYGGELAGFTKLDAVMADIQQTDAAVSGAIKES